LKNNRKISKEALLIFDLDNEFVWRIEDEDKEYLLVYKNEDLKVYKRVHLFQCASCKHQTSLTANTIMHKTHLSLMTWFHAIFLVSVNKKSISAKQLEGMIGVSYPTAWYLLHRIREAMMHPFSNLPLQGIVEADEAYFGGKSKGKRGRGAGNKTLVTVGVEERTKIIGDEPTIVTGRALMKIVDNASSEQLVDNFIEQNITVGSVVKTDGWVGYSPIDSNKYIHFPKPAAVDPEREHLQLVHLIVGNVKSWLKCIFHGAVGRHLQRYLTEFTYRFNRRHKIDTIFGRIVRNLLLGQPVLYKRLVCSKEYLDELGGVDHSPVLASAAVVKA
jgi:transposase-like protein